MHIMYTDASLNVFYLVPNFSRFFLLTPFYSSFFIGWTLFNYENPEGSDAGLPRRSVGSASSLYNIMYLQ